MDDRAHCTHPLSSILTSTRSSGAGRLHVISTYQHVVVMICTDTEQEHCNNRRHHPNVIAYRYAVAFCNAERLTTNLKNFSTLQVRFDKLPIISLRVAKKVWV